ncbi:MAG: chromophore lyase CpcT/CpeT [Planctomycetota bacterium]
MRLNVAVILTCSTILAGGCTTMGSLSSGEEAALSLETYLTGSFSSAAQHAQDPENFFDIRLVCVTIWEDRNDGPWLYIEQAAAEALDRPYRTRVYHLVAEPDGRVRSDVYTLPGERNAWAGAWRDVSRFDAIEPQDLTLRDGCSVFLTREGDAFVGGTEGAGCTSNLGNAAYATSEMTLLPDRLLTWDRGWTADGEQAWGAVDGGYEFIRTD